DQAEASGDLDRADRVARYPGLPRDRAHQVVGPDARSAPRAHEEAGPAGASDAGAPRPRAALPAGTPGARLARGSASALARALAVRRSGLRPRPDHRDVLLAALRAAQGRLVTPLHGSERDLEQGELVAQRFHHRVEALQVAP